MSTNQTKKNPHPEQVEKIQKRPRRAKRVDLNVVPLVDVLFMLLLFFILGTRFRQSEGLIPGTLPRVEGGIAKSDEKPEVLLPPIRIMVRSTADATGRDTPDYQMSGLAVPIEGPKDLYDKLMARKNGLGGSFKDTPIVIQPRPNVRWEYAVQAFNQAVRAQFPKIAFSATAD